MTRREADIDAFIAALDDETLARSRDEALDGNPVLTAAGREFLRKSDPRRCIMVKEMIYTAFERLGNDGAAVAVVNPPTAPAKVSAFLGTAPDRAWEDRW